LPIAPKGCSGRHTFKSQYQPHRSQTGVLEPKARKPFAVPTHPIEPNPLLILESCRNLYRFPSLLIIATKIPTRMDPIGLEISGLLWEMASARSILIRFAKLLGFLSLRLSRNTHCREKKAQPGPQEGIR
jgi:hypothetical protein